MKMEYQKITNLLDTAPDNVPRFITKKWVEVQWSNAENRYKPSKQIRFILVTGNITVTANNDVDVAFENCAPFSTCKTVINDVYIFKADRIYIAMPMYNLIKYSDNYSDTSGSLWDFKRYKFLLLMLIWVLIILNLLNTKQLL